METQLASKCYEIPNLEYFCGNTIKPSRTETRERKNGKKLERKQETESYATQVVDSQPGFGDCVADIQCTKRQSDC